MKTPKKILLLLAASAAFALTGCVGRNAASEEMRTEGLSELGKITVIAREEGSGTRSTFAELIGFDDGQNGQSDRTRDDAQIAASAQKVMEAVEADSAAIGYLSYGALSGESSVKAVDVDGMTPGTRDGKYPLGRSFYLAWCGTPDDAEQDFLAYIRGAGQQIVEKNYISVAKSGSFLSSMAAGDIRIEGSTSVGPLMEELAQSYMELNPNVQITVIQSDSTTGLTSAMSGECDFGMSSRDLKDYEKELLDYETIARDEIAVIVNKDNPLENVTAEALYAIYTGEWNTWGNCK